jgi:hypothetical protein
MLRAATATAGPGGPRVPATNDLCVPLSRSIAFRPFRFDGRAHVLVRPSTLFSAEWATSFGTDVVSSNMRATRMSWTIQPSAATSHTCHTGRSLDAFEPVKRGTFRDSGAHQVRSDEAQVERDISTFMASSGKAKTRNGDARIS